MKLLNPNFDFQDFQNKLQQSIKTYLLLDYDGTLAPHRAERDQAYAYPGVNEILDQLIADPKHEVILSTGRLIDDLLPLLQLKKTPQIWGAHGWQHLTDKGIETTYPEEDITNNLKKAQTWLQEKGLQSEAEIKPCSVAIHLRKFDQNQAQQLKEQARQTWKNLTIPNKLELMDFAGGLELRSRVRNKGFIIQEILKVILPHHPIAFLGDDVTDEDGFQVLQGKGLSILVKEDLTKTHADLWLQPPQELLNFLQFWLHPRKKIFFK